MDTWTPGRISLLVPSRGRPEQLAAMWASARETASGPTSRYLELVLYLDDDDPTVDQAIQAVQHDTWPGQVTARIGPRIMLSETWNRCLERSTGELLWHGNDDVLFRTPGWDDKIRLGAAQYPDGIVCVHGRDGIHDGAMATLGFYHRRWVEALGYFCPPYFSSDYNDLWLSQCADALDRRVFLPEIMTEHLHPAVGKAPMDQTHRDRLTRHVQDDVDGLYRRLAPERAADVEKLRAVMAP